MDNPMLYVATKNQPPRLIRSKDVSRFSLFDHEKGLFLPYLLFKLIEEVDIWCIDLVWVLNVPFRSFVYSLRYLPVPLPLLKKKKTSERGTHFIS